MYIFIYLLHGDLPWSSENDSMTFQEMIEFRLEKKNLKLFFCTIPSKINCFKTGRLIQRYPG